MEASKTHPLSVSVKVYQRVLAKGELNADGIITGAEGPDEREDKEEEGRTDSIGSHYCTPPQLCVYVCMCACMHLCVFPVCPGMSQP